MAEGDSSDDVYDVYDPLEKAIDTELKCPLCLCRFTTPKDLACPHVYCKECLENLRRVSGGGKKITCPECRQVTVLPSKGIDGLKTNLRIRNMVEAAERKDKLKTKQSMKRRPKVPKVPECGEHEGEKLHLYCETDDYLICHVCAVVDHPHPEHKCRNVKEVVEEQKDRDAGILCKASQRLDDLKEESNDIARSERLLTEFMAAEEAEILRCVRAIQKAAQQRGAIMINLMKQMHEDHINDLQQARGDIDEISTRLETVCAVVRDNLNTASDYEYVLQHQSLHANMSKQLHQKIPKTVDKNFPRMKFVSNKGTENMVNLGYLQTSKVKDVNGELCGRLTIGNAEVAATDRIEDIAPLSDGSLALVFTSRVNVYKAAGTYENLSDQEYTLKLSLDPPVGYNDKPCWVGLSSSSEDTPRVWLTHGVAELEDMYAVMDNTPFVKIFSAEGKFKRMFTTMKLPASSKEYKANMDNSDMSSSDTRQVNYTCITQDIDGKSLFLGDLAQQVITVHDSTGRCLNTFSLQDPPYKISIFGQRLAVTTIANRIDVLDKMTGDRISSTDVPLATGACVDIKSGCMFVTTTDDDSYEYENGTLEVYCSMTGTHMRCLVPVLYEPCGAMALMDEDKLAVVDRKGVNFYHLVYTYE
ncbi:tripartite motif-containing protein 2-like [Amphiura filiformis]|uniref:tripartite motif-containing protein 2-like n=1 Tax=Amphiura filiformis TaxID=82378 RepID=UPI003B2186F7